MDLFNSFSDNSSKYFSYLSFILSKFLIGSFLFPSVIYLIDFFNFSLFGIFKSLDIFPKMVMIYSYFQYAKMLNQRPLKFL